LTVGVLAIAGLSYRSLQEHAQDEEPTPLAEGTTELKALDQDPLWSALPSASIRRTDEHAAALSDWGEKFHTWKSVTLGERYDTALFNQAVAAIESSDWELYSSFCTEGSLSGTFAKRLPVGPAFLRITMSSYSNGVRVAAYVGPPSDPSQPQRCWGS